MYPEKVFVVMLQQISFVSLSIKITFLFYTHLRDLVGNVLVTLLNCETTEVWTALQIQSSLSTLNNAFLKLFLFLVKSVQASNISQMPFSGYTSLALNSHLVTVTQWFMCCECANRENIHGIQFSDLFGNPDITRFIFHSHFQLVVILLKLLNFNVS